MKLSSIKKFDEWHNHNATHQYRLANLIERHVENMNQWVESFKLPIGSPEFIQVTYRLHDEIAEMMDEYRESFQSLADDFDTLKDALETLDQEIDKLPEDW